MSPFFMGEIHILRNIGCKQRTNESFVNLVSFPNDLQKIDQFSIILEAERLNPQSDIVRKTYIIEIHEYVGFAMIKFYPRERKNHPKKYELRSHELGFRLEFKSFRILLKESTRLMKEYLDNNPDCLIGYIGQPDDSDHNSKVDPETSKRARVYNSWVYTMFQKHKYAYPEPHKYRDLNLNLIRKVSKHETKLTQKQEANYELFRKALLVNEAELLGFMTENTRKKYR